MASDKTSRSHLSGYALICLSHTFMHTFTDIHIALIPILRTELGLNTLTIGLMASTPLLIQAILTIPGGLLADKTSQTRIIAAGLVISAIGGILMSQVNSIPLLIFFISLFSISPPLLHPAALSAISSFVSGKGRGRALGFFNSAGTFGMALGPITLGLLIAVIGWRFIYLMWSIPALLMAVLILRLKFEKAIEPKSRQHEESDFSQFHVFRNMGLILLFAAMGARSMSGTVINTYVTPYFVDSWKIDPATASLIFGIRPLVGILAAPIGGLMVDKIGEKRWITIDLIVQIASLLVTALPPSQSLMILSYLVYGFFGNMEMPAVQSLMVKMTPSGGRGLVFSLSFLPGTLAGAFSPILAVPIVGAYGIWYIFPFALAMLVTALFVLAPLHVKPETNKE